MLSSERLFRLADASHGADFAASACRFRQLQAAVIRRQLLC